MKLIPIILLSFILISSGCATSNRSAWTTKDSWYSYPDKRISAAWEFEEIAFSEVKYKYEADAIKLLESSQIHEISKEKMLEFAQTPLKYNKNMNFYLVRALYLNKGTGGFSVSAQGNQLWVSHGSLGHSAVPMSRTALVIALKEKPQDIYITCSMDE